VLSTLCCALARPALAQGVARVSYRTREIVFVTAGRDDGLAVGDTVTILREDGSALVTGVVVSAALHSASVRLTGPDDGLATGLQVAFVPHPPEAPADSAGLAPPPDTAVAGDSTAYAVPAAAPRPPPRRLHGGIHLEQYGSSTAANPGMKTLQTVGALDLDAPVASGVDLLVRTTTRYRSGESRALVGTPELTTIPYQLELRLAPPGAAWSASVGRFVPADAMGLGYIDGARVDVRVAPGHRLGIIGGVVPEAERLRFSTDAKRIGGYWAFGTGERAQGSLSAAADFGQGARRRTEVAGQTYWRVASGVRVSGYGEVDLPVSGGPFTGVRLTTLVGGVNADLPFAVRGGLTLETHEPLPLWDPSLPPDTTPLPGRLDGVTASLGRTFGGVSLDLTGGALRRQGDPTATLRGTLTASTRGVYASIMLVHGDLADYRTAMVRFVVPPRVLPFTLALGAAASQTTSGGGAFTFWRYSFRPELSWFLGRGFFATAGGDIGSYAGQSSTWLHGGLSYRFH